MKQQSRKLLAVALAALAPSAWASGFALMNQNGSGNGNAFAGAAASTEDAGIIYFNPAGMTALGEGSNLSVAGTVIDRSIKYTDKGSQSNSPAAPLRSTANGGDAGGTALVPAGYWAYALSNQLWLGVGISPTFGNKTEYDYDFVGRNAGYFAEMQQININPSLAFKLNEQISLGFGVDIAHNMTHFKQGYPFTALVAYASPNNYADIKGDAWGYGYNFGVTYSVTPATRLALTYRSTIKFDLEGKYDVNTPVSAVGFVDQDIKATLKTPDSASLALSQKLSDQLELLADATWTGWSVIDSIAVQNKSTNATVATLSYNFKDTWRYGIGANYKLNDQWKLRTGLAYDQSPVKSDADRTMTLPDSDRTWLSFGARYSLSKASSIDMGYTHLFFKDASTNREVRASTGTLLQTVKGDFKTSADLFSLQYNQKF
jgi:long-chain fatty acid transport protein